MIISPNPEFPRGVFFDLFGTLFIYGDMKKAWADWFDHFYISMKDLGLSISRDEFSLACDRFFRKDEPPEEKGLTVFERRIRSLSNRLEMSPAPKDLQSTANLIVGKWQEQVSLDPVALSTLRKLRKTKSLGLVSNFDHPPHVRCCLAKYGMDEFFDTIVISGEVGVKKPDPTIFVPALQETGLNPAEVVFVGDTEEDMDAAKAAGIKPVLIQREKGTDLSSLDYSVKQTKQALKIKENVFTISGLDELKGFVEP